MPYYVYILHSTKTNKYYTGSCEDIEIRLAQHNSGRSKSTRAGAPWIMLYYEQYETRIAAVNSENEIKSKKSRKYIEWLISPVG